MGSKRRTNDATVEVRWSDRAWGFEREANKDDDLYERRLSYMSAVVCY